MANLNTLCNEGTGTIIVQAYTANGSLPVEGAKVTVYDSGRNVELYTDNSGRTDGVKICVPRASNSQKEGNGNTYGTVDIKVEKQGYYTEDFLDVAVVDGIVSIQPASLEPIGENVAETDQRPRLQTDNQIGSGGAISDNSARIGDALIIKEQPLPVADAGQEVE